MKKYIFILIVPLLVCSKYPGGDQDHNPEITSRELKNHIYYLASDKMKGRFTGSKECLEAANYIQNQFESYGLKPLFDNGFKQTFPFISGVDKR
jgi:aminopeptidase YwaD